MGEISKTAITRFFAKVEKTENCWLWTATKHKFGYGSFSYKSKKIGSHVFSFMLHKGDIEKGRCVRHICDVPECVNPDHLILGTQLDNLRDMSSRGRGKNQNTDKEVCKNGHELKGDNLKVHKNGKRNCRICMATIAKNYRTRRKLLAKWQK